MPQESRQPYTLIGADQLTAFVYKTGDELMGFDYRFNITRLENQIDWVNQWLTPDDLFSMVKLVRVLAAELADDGCMNVELRDQLFRLAAVLDDVIAEGSPSATTHGAANS